MDIKSNYLLKTLGPREAHFIIGLYEINKSIFNLQARILSQIIEMNLQNRIFKQLSSSQILAFFITNYKIRICKRSSSQ